MLSALQLSEIKAIALNSLGHVVEKTTQRRSLFSLASEDIVVEAPKIYWLAYPVAANISTKRLLSLFFTEEDSPPLAHLKEILSKPMSSPMAIMVISSVFCSLEKSELDYPITIAAHEDFSEESRYVRSGKIFTGYRIILEGDLLPIDSKDTRGDSGASLWAFIQRAFSKKPAVIKKELLVLANKEEKTSIPCNFLPILPQHTLEEITELEDFLLRAWDGKGIFIYTSKTDCRNTRNIFAQDQALRDLIAEMKAYLRTTVTPGVLALCDLLEIIETEMASCNRFSTQYYMPYCKNILRKVQQRNALFLGSTCSIQFETGQYLACEDFLESQSSADACSAATAVRISASRSNLHSPDVRQKVCFSERQKAQVFVIEPSNDVDRPFTFHLRTKDGSYLIISEQDVFFSQHTQQTWYLHPEEQEGAYCLVTQGATLSLSAGTTCGAYSPKRAIITSVHNVQAQDIFSRWGQALESMTLSPNLLRKVMMTEAVAKKAQPQEEEDETRVLLFFYRILPMLKLSKGKSLVPVIGNSGVGKSTFVNYMIKHEFDFSEKKGLMVRDTTKPFAVMNNTENSETWCPTVYEKRGVAFCDCPGFEDTRPGFEELNAFSMLLSTAFAAELKAIIIVIDLKELSSIDGSKFQQLALILSKLIIGNEYIANNIFFIINKRNSYYSNQEIIGPGDSLLTKLSRNISSDIEKHQNDILLLRTALEEVIGTCASEADVQKRIEALSAKDKSKYAFQQAMLLLSRTALSNQLTALQIIEMINTENTFIWNTYNDPACRKKLSQSLRSLRQPLPREAVRFDRLSQENSHFETKLLRWIENYRNDLARFSETEKAVTRKIDAFRLYLGKTIPALVELIQGTPDKLTQLYTELTSYLEDIVPYQNVELIGSNAPIVSLWPWAEAQTKPYTGPIFTVLHLEEELALLGYRLKIFSAEVTLKKIHGEALKPGTEVIAGKEVTHYSGYTARYQAQNAYADIPDGFVVGNVRGLKIDDPQNILNFNGLKTRIEALFKDLETFVKNCLWLETLDGWAPFCHALSEAHSSMHLSENPSDPISEAVEPTKLPLSENRRYLSIGLVVLKPLMQTLDILIQRLRALPEQTLSQLHKKRDDYEMHMKAQSDELKAFRALEIESALAKQMVKDHKSYFMEIYMGLLIIVQALPETKQAAYTGFMELFEQNYCPTSESLSVEQGISSEQEELSVLLEILRKFFSNEKRVKKIGRLKETAQMYNLVIQDLPSGSGNNFFNALCAQLTYWHLIAEKTTAEDVYSEFFCHLIENLICYLELQDNFLEEQIARSENPQSLTWVNDFILFVVMRCFQVNIFIFGRSGHQPRVLKRARASRAIYLIFDGNIYYSLLPARNFSEASATSLHTFLEREQRVDDWESELNLSAGNFSSALQGLRKTATSALARAAISAGAALSGVQTSVDVGAAAANAAKAAAAAVFPAAADAAKSFLSSMVGFASGEGSTTRMFAGGYPSFYSTPTHAPSAQAVRPDLLSQGSSEAPALSTQDTSLDSEEEDDDATSSNHSHSSTL